jgi:hypothetical protein
MGRWRREREGDHNCLAWSVSCPFLIEANFEDDPDDEERCCVDPSMRRAPDPCAWNEGLSCGLFEGYGEIWSECCTDVDGSLAVLYCDAGGISLMSEKCRSPFSCVQHTGIISKKRGQTGPYAQCEQ